VATDASGNVYVADSGNKRIEKFAPMSVPSVSPWGLLGLTTLLLGGGVLSLSWRASRPETGGT
jgi:hypothetical protein